MSRKQLTHETIRKTKIYFHLWLVFDVLKHLLRLLHFQPVVLRSFEQFAFKLLLSLPDFYKTQFCFFQRGLTRQTESERYSSVSVHLFFCARVCCNLVVVLNSLISLSDFLLVLPRLRYFSLCHIKFLFQGQLLGGFWYVQPGPPPTNLMRDTHTRTRRSKWCGAFRSTVQRGHLSRQQNLHRDCLEDFGRQQIIDNMEQYVVTLSTPEVFEVILCWLFI